jgi:hypothetical protein
MNSKLVLIATVIIAALIIGGAVTYAVMVGQGANNSAAAPANGGPMTEQVTVPDSLAVCNAGDKCLVVDTTCSFCCKYVAINARHEQLFDEMYAQSCASYEGNMCECFDLNSYPSCVAGKCTMVKMPITP